jgi:DNA (cytosine-5-)-methyltransferase|nr:endonuclease domain-containing protein [uncultured Cardiobacterium sp.]
MSKTYRPAISDRTQKQAKSLRRAMTEAEQRLWYHLRNRRLNGYKFKRQYPIGNYIADFICLEKNLIIEADGGQHNDNPRDDARTAWLQAQGYTVLRYWNHDILQQTEAVLTHILHHLENRDGK